MIMYSNAIVDPWAVMIKSLNTFVTDGTVSRTRSTKHFTVWAHLTRMHVPQDVKEVMAWFYAAWIKRGSKYKADGNTWSKRRYYEEDDWIVLI